MEGGIVINPQLAIIGIGEGEVVIPLSQLKCQNEIPIVIDVKYDEIKIIKKAFNNG